MLGQAHSERIVALIVDDEPLVCHLAAEILRRIGCFTLLAYDGQQALEASRSHPGPIDLLLSDVKMPKLSGPELCHQVKRDRPEIFCLLMSGDISGMNIGEELPFIPKPFTPSALRLKVQELLSSVDSLGLQIAGGSRA